MQTTIRSLSPVEYALDLHATADDLAPDLEKALRAQRLRTSLKGFRPGKVPLALVKKMYGEALGYGVAEQRIKDAYEREVLDNPAYDVLGQPKVTRLDYALDGDLEATVVFGVRPEVTLAPLGEEEVTRLVLDVTDEDVELELTRLRERHADLAPLDDEAAIEADHFVVLDLQELDPETGTPIIGKRDEDQTIFLGDPDVDEHPMLRELKQALLGARPGQARRFSFEHDAAHGHHEAGHAHRHHFEATVKEVKRRDLPELDDAFAREVSQGQLESVEALRGQIEAEMRRSLERHTREHFEGAMVERLLERHPVPVPDSVVELYLDSFVEDVKQRNKGKLPEGFDEAAFRHVNRDDAERQGRWMLIRDQIIAENELEVTDADLEAFFAQEVSGEGQVTAEQLQRFYQSMPGLMDQVRQRVLSAKVFDYLAGQFKVVEKDRAAAEQEAAEAE